MIRTIKGLERKITQEMEDKYFFNFSKQASYVGNGVYSVPMSNIFSTDTRELFLIFIGINEGIKFKLD